MNKFVCFLDMSESNNIDERVLLIKATDIVLAKEKVLKHIEWYDSKKSLAEMWQDLEEQIAHISITEFKENLEDDVVEIMTLQI